MSVNAPQGTGIISSLKQRFLFIKKRKMSHKLVYVEAEKIMNSQIKHKNKIWKNPITPYKTLKITNSTIAQPQRRNDSPLGTKPPQ